MKLIFVWLPLLIFSIFLFYLLWINGLLVISRKTAVLFIGLLRLRGKCKVKCASCNGYIKKVIKIKESRIYKFNFNSNISKGNIIAEVQDKNKKTLFQIDKNNLEHDIFLDNNKRYYLVLNFENADGEIELSWS